MIKDNLNVENNEEVMEMENELTTVEIAEKEIEGNKDKKKGDFSKTAIAEGIYEVFIEKAEVKKFKTGTMGLNLNLRIKKEVNKRFQNWVVFDTIYLTESSKWRKDSFLIALGLKEKAEDKYEATINELIEDILNKDLKIVVEHEEFVHKNILRKKAVVDKYIRIEEKEKEDLTDEIDFDEVIIF